MTHRAPAPTPGPALALPRRQPPPAWLRVLLLALLAAAAGAASVRAAEPAATAGARQLLGRVLPARQAAQFILEPLAADNGHDAFEIESRGGGIVLRGNNGVALASALHRYLKQYCHCELSWNGGDQLRLPACLPPVPEKLRVVSPHRYRYAYNYCTHGYTMAWWDWPRWERELDFLALSGINLALVIEGQEQVWINTLKTFGYTDAELRQWLVMPSHQPWMYMSNLEGYGGPVPQSLIGRRAELGRQIVARMRELGIEPVLQGYYGIVPADFGKRFPEAKVHPQGKWGALKRPDMLEPTDPMFARLAGAFYGAQRELLGRAGFFAADPFHEGGSTTGIDVPAGGRAIHRAMQGGVWVLQSWETNPRQAMIDCLDKDRLLVLDLWCETQENWRSRTNFNNTPWLWCTIHNFGGNVGLGGRLGWMAEGPAQALADPAKGRLSGVGALMEGTGSNPVLWELFFENAWRAAAPPLDAWLNDYARRRYGASIPAAEQAWKILADSVYGPPPSRIEYPINSSVCARPSFKPEARARAMATTQPNYDPARLVQAWKLLLDAAPQAAPSDGYRYDLADVGREVLAGLGTRCHGEILAAYRAKDKPALRAASDRMLGLIRDMDELAGTQPEFLLGRWLQDARSWGDTPAAKDLCERNARELLTIWSSTYNITDYANRQWNGLLGSFYYHRWEMWLKALNDSLATGAPLNDAVVRDRIYAWELAWTRQTAPFPAAPHGDVVSLSRSYFAKYVQP